MELEGLLSFVYTYGLRVNGMNSKEDSCDKGQAVVFENSFVTSIHQDKCHQAVQNYIHGMEIEGIHPSQ